MKGDYRSRFLKRMGNGSPFYRLFDHMPEVAFFAKDEEFRIVCASRRFVERFGFRDESEIVGKTDFDLFPPRLAESFRADDEQVMASLLPKLNIVELFFTDQGLPDWFVTNKLPVLDEAGAAIGVMGTVQSYAGRKEVIQPYLHLERAVTFIREHFRKGVSVAEVADQVHLSTRQLHRKFVDAFGMSPQSFMLKLRIQAACDMLQNEGAQISEVAREVGFSDQSGFTHHFVKQMGITPLQYLKRYRLVRRS
jgi:AraC-like DNA-binding protein